MKFWTFAWTSNTWNKCNVEKAIFFLILPKYNSVRSLQHWYSKCNSKGICLAAQNGRPNWKFAFINAIAVSLLLLHLSFACNPTSYFNMGKKLGRHISFSSTCSCHYRNHTNNDNKICPLASSASNSTFMTDSHYLGTIQTWRSLNEHNYY